ncbi:MAG: thymidylate synthase [Deltaproteobacteria bacterium]|nr:thymidylate synthase [Deltaproteobacteria bacterium]
MKPIFIEATTIPDAWFQCLYTLIDESRKPDGAARRYTVATGSNPGADRIEFDLAMVHIKYPGVRPLLPQIPEHLNLPAVADEKYLNEYMLYLLSSQKAPHEHYTYGERLQVAWQYVIDYYRTYGALTNRMCMEVGRPEDVFFYNDESGSSPCLRLVDTRIMDNKLHWVLYFRSWNLWSGFPVNLAGLQQAKEIMAAEIGVEDGELVAISKGLNIRDYNIEVALMRLQKDTKIALGARRE